VATPDGLAVPVEYDRPGRDEAGLALVSAEDGEVMWQHETGSAEETRRVLWAADDRVALLTVAAEDLTTIAVDLATGEEVWDAPDVWPAAIAGDTALLVSSPESLEDPAAAVHMPAGDLAGADLVTGQPRWDFDGEAEVVLTAGDVTLLRAGDKDVLVDAAGAELGALGEQRGCVTDGSTLIACPVDYSGIRVFDLTTREITTATFDDEFASLDSAAAGRLFLRDRAGGFFGADKFGNRIDENLPSGVTVVSDTHVLFRSQGEGGPVVSVHPLTV
jgi:outer membrane protein assembly factor BamB